MVRIRFHGDLQALLPRGRRGPDVETGLNRRASAKDLIESFGIPHTEIGGVRIGGIPVDASFVLDPRGAAEVLIEVDPAVFTADRDDPDPRFVLDVHLGRLARLLRLLGFDALYRNDAEDTALARVSTSEHRWLLTRDRKLLMHRAVVLGRCVRADDPLEQARETVRYFGLAARMQPWTRCLRCGGLVERVAKEEVLSRLEPRTRMYYDRFLRCNACGSVYWAGSHHPALRALIGAVTGEP